MQEFQAGVEGGVAGRDIINKAPAFLIGGNVGAALNVKEAGAVHIHMGTASGIGSASEQEINRVVSTLLRTCKDAGCKQAVERISLALFGNSMFKNLGIEQLLKLQQIADGLVSQTGTARQQSDRLATELAQERQNSAQLQSQLDKALADLKTSRQFSEAAASNEQQLRQQLITVHQQAQATIAENQRQLKKDNEQLATENAWLRKRTQQACPDCHDKESRLANTRHHLAAVAGAALCAFVTAGYFAWQG